MKNCDCFQVYVTRDTRLTKVPTTSLLRELIARGEELVKFVTSHEEERHVFSSSVNELRNIYLIYIITIARSEKCVG